MNHFSQASEIWYSNSITNTNANSLIKYVNLKLQTGDSHEPLR
jgi:hypothetical protein